MGDVRPVRSEEEYQQALLEIEELWDCEPGTPSHDRLEVLAILVDAYEREHHPIEAPDPIAAIRFRMEQGGLQNKDLEPFIGTRGRVSEVLSGRRGLTLPMIRRLHEGLGIPAESLIRTRHWENA